MNDTDTMLYSDSQSIIIMPLFPIHTGPVICAALSAIACLLMLLTACFSGLHKEVFGKMACWILLGDLFFFIPKIIAGFSYEKTLLFCKFMGFSTEIGRTSSFFWAAMFAHAFSLVLKYQDPNIVGEFMGAYNLFANLGGALFAFTSVLTPLVLLDSDKLACVHEVYKGEVDYLYIIFADGPLIIGCGLTIWWYIVAIFRLRRFLSRDLSRDEISLMLYPLIMLICWLPNLVVNVMTFFDFEPSDELLITLEAVAHMQGLLDALVYGGSKKMLRQIKKGPCACIKRQKRPHNSSALANQSGFDEVISSTEHLHKSEDERLIMKDLSKRQATKSSFHVQSNAMPRNLQSVLLSNY